MAAEAPQADSPFWWFWERFTSTHEVLYKLSKGRIGGRMMGGPIVLVDTVGRKSGKRRTHPLLCMPDGDDFVVVASKGGIERNPAWYHNLMANPDTEINWRGEKRTVRAREAGDAERAELWPRLIEVYRGWDHYQRRTERKIPVIVLERRD